MAVKKRPPGSDQANNLEDLRDAVAAHHMAYTERFDELAQHSVSWRSKADNKLASVGKNIERLVNDFATIEKGWEREKDTNRRFRDEIAAKLNKVGRASSELVEKFRNLEERYKYSGDLDARVKPLKIDMARFKEGLNRVQNQIVELREAALEKDY